MKHLMTCIPYTYDERIGKSWCTIVIGSYKEYHFIFVKYLTQNYHDKLYLFGKIHANYPVVGPDDQSLDRQILTFDI